MAMDSSAGGSPKVALPDILPNLTPPTGEEKDNYYWGMLSPPRLVGRTSSGVVAWDGDDPREKCLATIGEHAILGCWEKVWPKLVQALGQLPWTSMEVFRIVRPVKPLPIYEYGEEDGQEPVVYGGPVVVWVGVGEVDDENSDSSAHGDGNDDKCRKACEWEEVARALRACRRVLDEAGLADVECEMRESTVGELADTTTGTTDDTMNDTATQRPPLIVDGFGIPDEQLMLMPVSVGVGQSIFAYPDHDRRGTLGLYLSVNDEDDEDDGSSDNKAIQENKPPLWALTCRHVALPPLQHPEARGYRRTDLHSQPALPIGLPCTPCLEKELNVTRFEQARAAAVLAHHSLAPADRSTTTARAARLSSIAHTLAAFSPLDARRLGSVFLAPPKEPVSTNPDDETASAWSRDWCLVDLDRAKFPRGDPVNYVNLESPYVGLWQLDELLHPWPQSPRRFSCPADGQFRLGGVLSILEMLRPQDRDKDGDPCLIVGKRGARTGMTWGVVSELMSVRRTGLQNNGQGYMARELVVGARMTVPKTEQLPQSSVRTDTAKESKNAFSDGGDSGAAVFDTRGRICGLVTRGTPRHSGRMNITYVTPFPYILADMERELGKRVRIL